MNAYLCFGIMLLCCLTGSTAWSSSVESCFPALRPDELKLLKDESFKLNYLNIIDTHTYEAEKNKFSGKVNFGDILTSSADYEDFKKKRDDEFRKLHFSVSRESSVFYVSSKLSDNSKSAFESCLKIIALQSNGFQAWVTNVTKSDVTLWLRWSPRPASNETRIDVASHIGVMEGFENIPNKLLINEEKAVTLSRREGARMHIVLNTEGGAVVVEVPEWPKEPEPALKPFWCKEKTNIPLDVMVHQQNKGDIWGGDDWVGVSGKSLRIEGVVVKFRNSDTGAPIDGLGLEYVCHVQNFGDVGPFSSGGFCGTRGKSLRMEGFFIRVTGPLAKYFTVQYACHIANFGNTAIMKDGDFCGARGQSKQIESLYVSLSSTGVCPP